MFDNEFKLKNNSELYKLNRNRPIKNSIIKNDTLVVGQPKKIEPFNFSHGHLSQTTVSPIEQDGEIKGFVFECACGEVVELLLEYDQLSQVS